MTDHPTTTDYRNREERTEAFWREIAGELAGAVDEAGCFDCDYDIINAALSRYTAAIGEAKP